MRTTRWLATAAGLVLLTGVSLAAGTGDGHWKKQHEENKDHWERTHKRFKGHRKTQTNQNEKHTKIQTSQWKAFSGRQQRENHNFWERLKKSGPTDILTVEGDDGTRIQVWIE